MLERLVRRSQATRLSGQTITEQLPAYKDTRWRVLEPPSLAVRELLRDLRSVWGKELGDLSVSRKFPFLILRVLQNLAYRRGFGLSSMNTCVPLPPSPDFSQMERNLTAIPGPERMSWLLTFYAQLNNPVPAEHAAPPTSVVLELSGNCNLNCVGCGQGSHGIAPHRYIARSDLHRWTAETCGRAQLIRINGLGESTLHPELDYCLEILRRYPGGREIISNLTASTQVYLKLLDDGFALLLSWDAATKETMARIRRGADYDSMLRKLPVLAQRAEQNSCPRPTLLFTLREENVDHLPDVVTLAAQAGRLRVTVNVFRRHDHRDWTAPHRTRLTDLFGAAAALAESNGVELALPDHLGEARLTGRFCQPSPGSSCAFPATQVVIRHNGDVTPCNMLNPYLYGSLRQKSFDSIWRGPEAAAFRRLCGSHPYCRYCYYVSVADVPKRTMEN